jgi:creatinine amidohydrolase
LGKSVPPKRDWVDMIWEDFSGPDKARWIAVVPIAAVEQHGPHLPLGTDAFIGAAYLARAREMLPDALPVTFLPLQWVGTSDEHRAFPGTLTLAAQSVIRLLTEIGESVHRAGLRKIVIANSHGGNVAAIDLAVRDLRVRLGMLAVACSWSRLGYPEGLFTAEERVHGIHAGAIETSILLAARPDLVRADRAVSFASASIDMAQTFRHLRLDGAAGLGWMSQDLNPAGAMGDAKSATADKGKAALDHGARAFVALLGEVDRFDLDRLKEGPVRRSPDKAQR